MWIPSWFILAEVAGPMPWNLPTGRASTKAGPILRRDDEQPVRLAVVGGQLGQELVVGDPGRGGQRRLGLDAGPDALRDLGRGGDALQVLGDVEIGLVERERLDQRRVLGEDRPDLQRHRLVDIEARRHEDQLGTFPPGGDRRHGRMHAELPGFVARGGDDAPLARAADRDRPAAQLRMVPLLDRGVEGIHVDVDDLACRPSTGHGGRALGRAAYRLLVGIGVGQGRTIRTRRAPRPASRRGPR